MSQHNLLRISSKDRDPALSRSPSDFTISFGNSPGVQSVKRVVVKQISIPNTVYNINPNNNQFQYKTATSITIVTVPVGQYSISQFKTAFESALSGVGMTIDLNNITKKYEFATTTPIEYLSLAEGNLMGDVLGIQTGSGADVGTFSANGLPNLSGLNEVYIQSNKLADNSNMISSANQATPVIACVPLTSEFGGYTHYLSSHDILDEVQYASQRLGKNLQQIDIKIVDRDGNIVDLHGLEFEMVLKMFY